MSMDEKPLHIPPKKKIPGLKIYCYGCGTLVEGKCKQSGKSLSTCAYGDKQRYKVIVHVPGTKNERKTKILETREYDEAVKQALDFQKEIKEAGKPEIEKTAPVPLVSVAPIEPLVRPVFPNTEQTPEKTYNLLELMSEYIGFLNNENVPEHRQKERTKEHIEQVERMFRYFAASLKKSGYDIESLRVDQINDTMIGKFHKYLQEDLKQGPRSYNRAMSILTSFYKHLARQGYLIGNPFETVTRQAVNENIETIDEDEFMRLLEIVQKPELGWRTLLNGKRKNLYKPWFKDALELGVYSGRRREEVARMKWSDVVYDKNGVPLHLQVPDYKVNRQKGLSEENWKYNYAPMTSELRDLLTRLGEEEHKGKDAYLIAPDETMQRDTITSFLSRSFSHYYEQLQTGKELTFGCLRRTNISHLSGELGMENAQAITGHANTKIMKKHYADKRILAHAAQNFTVFNKEKREAELKELRKKSTPDKDPDITD
ncbi:MAG: Uncharacterized protein FD123_385 [Bacteroidetes bacterium]|nr:MAG: Uncharacterized protein FD123_385 [Bacteroidota bacterium]